MSWAIKCQGGYWLTPIGYFRIEKFKNIYSIVFKHYISHSEFYIEDFDTKEEAQNYLDELIYQIFGKDVIYEVPSIRKTNNKT